jgi:hypothetical protein
VGCLLLAAPFAPCQTWESTSAPIQDWIGVAASADASKVVAVAINHQLSINAQGTAFTYQGRLNDGASPANGSYDLRSIQFWFTALTANPTLSTARRVCR